MYVVTATQKLLGCISYCVYRNIVLTWYYVEKKDISDPIEIRTLRIGNFAAQIENDPGGLILGTKTKGDQRKILRFVVWSDFSWVVREK